MKRDRRSLFVGLMLAGGIQLPLNAADPAQRPVPASPDPSGAPDQVVLVGPQQRVKTPRAAARAARDGSLVLIEAGTYSGDVAVWRQNRLTLRGSGGVVHLLAAGRLAEGKAIWVITGDDVTVENIDFSGARAAAHNGAGIRFEGGRLTLRQCRFHDNEMGLLTHNRGDSEIVIEGSEFDRNRADYRRYGRLGHNVYIGRSARLTLRNSYIHDARVGHEVKSRARENYILYNRIADEGGASSYLVDLPEGGRAYLIGNLLQQSRSSENLTAIAFAAEANRQDPRQTLEVVNNTFVNAAAQGTFVKNFSVAPARLRNNLIIGNNTMLLAGAGELHDNLRADPGDLRAPERYDYRLAPGSAAIDAARDPGYSDQGLNLLPTHQYRHPRQVRPRPRRGALDIGAYEYVGE